MDRVVDLGQHATGGTDLDDLGVQPQLSADGLDGLRHAVTDLQHPAAVPELLHPVQRDVVRIAVAAGRGQDRVGGVEPRCTDQALLAHLLDVDAEAADLAHGRHAHAQRSLDVPRRAQDLRLQPAGDDLVDLEVLDPEGVDVAVPQARHHGVAADDVGALGLGRLRARSRVGDPVVLDDDRGVVDGLATTGQQLAGNDSLGRGHRSDPWVRIWYWLVISATTVPASSVISSTSSKSALPCSSASASRRVTSSGSIEAVTDSRPRPGAR